MIEVRVGNNTHRVKDIVAPNETLRSVLEKHNINYAEGGVQLDGATLGAGDLDKTFEDFNIKEKCWLLTIAKRDNAAA